MAHYEVSAEIAAPPQRVWAVMADIERWPEWSASFRSIEKPTAGEKGRGTRARIRQPRLAGIAWTVTEVEPGAYFAWSAGAPGMRSVAGQRITPAGEGCRVTLSL